MSKTFGPRRVSVTDLKAHATALVTRASTGTAFLITKRGVPVAQLIPFHAKSEYGPNRQRGSVVELGDIVAPIGEEWEAEQ